MLPDRLAQIRQRVEAATPGEWESEFHGTIDNYYVWTKDKPRKYICSARPENAELIAAAKSDIEYLLTVCEVLLGAMEELQTKHAMLNVKLIARAALEEVRNL